MFASVNRISLLPLAAVGVLLTAVVASGCSDSTGNVATSTSAVTTTQADTGGNGGSGGGGDGGTPGGFGTATVTVSAGTYELQVEEACIFSEVGIGAIASSDEASLVIGGPQEIAVINFELSAGELWSAIAANVVVDGTTMSYSGPAISPPGEDATISVQVFCD